MATEKTRGPLRKSLSVTLTVQEFADVTTISNATGISKARIWSDAIAAGTVDQLHDRAEKIRNRGRESA